MITILAIGKKHEDWVEPGIARYEKRLRKPYDAKWELLPHSSLAENAARNEESERLLKRLGADDVVVLLDERGKQLSTPEFGELLEAPLHRSQSVVLVIGGAYGVTEAVHERANHIVSLSKMVFPHQLVRLIVTEQLYRVQSIASGGKYHHE